MIREIINEYENDYEDNIQELYEDEYDEIKRLEPDMDIINYDEIERWKFNEGDDMWDMFERHMGCEINLKPQVVCSIIRAVVGEYPDIDASWKWEDIFNIYVFMHASYICNEKKECQFERLEKYIELRKKNCSRVIQRQWEKCRYDPEYKMCETVLLNNLRADGVDV